MKVTSWDRQDVCQKTTQFAPVSACIRRVSRAAVTVLVVPRRFASGRHNPPDVLRGEKRRHGRARHHAHELILGILARGVFPSSCCISGGGGSSVARPHVRPNIGNECSSRSFW